MLESQMIISFIFAAFTGVGIFVIAKLLYVKLLNNDAKEVFFSGPVKINLKKISQYFLDVERATTYNEEYEEDSKNMMIELNTFYEKNSQDMEEIFKQTTIGFLAWHSLSSKDEPIMIKILETFAWLRNDYYPMSKLESTRKDIVLGFRDTFYEKKDWLMIATNDLLKKYSDKTK